MISDTLSQIGCDLADREPAAALALHRAAMDVRRLERMVAGIVADAIADEQARVASSNDVVVVDFTRRRP